MMTRRWPQSAVIDGLLNPELLFRHRPQKGDETTKVSELGDLEGYQGVCNWDYGADGVEEFCNPGSVTPMSVQSESVRTQSVLSTAPKQPANPSASDPPERVYIRRDLKTKKGEWYRTKEACEAAILEYGGVMYEADWGGV